MLGNATEEVKRASCGVFSAADDAASCSCGQACLVEDPPISTLATAYERAEDVVEMDHGGIRVKAR